MINHEDSSNMTPEDIEWMTDIFSQAQICRAEANALEQFCTSKLENKYKLHINYGDRINFKTGEITRAQLPVKPPNLSL